MRGIILMVVALAMHLCQQVNADSMNPNTDWMPGKIMAFMHYLPKENERSMVDGFDVNGLKKQLVEMDVDCFIFTMGQNNNFYNAPNESYRKIAGRDSPTKFSDRDLPEEIIAALRDTRIRFGLYTPCQPSFRDEVAERALGFEPMHPGTPDDWYMTDCGAENWSKVIAEWANRYGEKVSIWWFDGARPDMRFSERHGKILRDVLLNSNPKMVMSFNYGLLDSPTLMKNEYEMCCEKDPSFAERMPFREFTGISKQIVARQWISASDYISGEADQPFRFVPTSRWFAGNQHFILTYLGHYWGESHIRYPDDIWIKFLRQYLKLGGSIAFDMAIDRATGNFNVDQVLQMRRIIRTLRMPQ